MNDFPTNRRFTGILFIAASILLVVSLGSYQLLRLMLLVLAVSLFFSGLSLLRPHTKKSYKKGRYNKKSTE